MACRGEAVPRPWMTNGAFLLRHARVGGFDLLQVIYIRRFHNAMLGDDARNITVWGDVECGISHLEM